MESKEDRMTSPIQEFYNNQCILLTGATGFIGKVLLEKLLRSCPGVKKIFLIIREKHGYSTCDRLASLLTTPVFDNIRQIEATSGDKLFKKLVPLCGDICKPRLGLSLEDWQLLCREVTTIFHVAAGISFDADLQTAMKVNVWATQELMELAKNMDNLKAFVHTSTAYSNCIFSEIGEIVYDHRTKLSSLYKQLSADVSDTATHEFLRRWPNNYTLTKALAEIVVEDNCENISVAILRPSIVLSSWQEPVPGWVDSFSGPSLHLTAIGLGYLHCIHTGLGTLADIVPVDMVANCMVAAAWDVAQLKSAKMPRVYNFVSCEANSLTWDSFIHYCKNAVRGFPFAMTNWYPFVVVCHTRTTYLLLDFFLHLVPSLLLDMLHIFMTRERKYFRRYKWSKIRISQLHYFLCNHWKFAKGNVQQLLGKMTPDDCLTFHFDVSTVKWESFLRNYALGIRKYLLKEDDETLSHCKKCLYRFYLLHHTLIFAVMTGIAFPIFFALWNIIHFTL